MTNALRISCAIIGVVLLIFAYGLIVYYGMIVYYGLIGDKNKTAPLTCNQTYINFVKLPTPEWTPLELDGLLYWWSADTTRLDDPRIIPTEISFDFFEYSDPTPILIRNEEIQRDSLRK